MKTKILLVVLTLFIGLAVSLVSFEPTNALPSAPLRRGYFTNSRGPSTLHLETVLNNGLMNGNYPTGSTSRDTVMDSSKWAFNLTDKAEFITFFENKLGGSTKDRVGASFIINNILGKLGKGSGGSPRILKKSYPEVQEWKDFMKQTDVSLVTSKYATDYYNSAFMVATKEVETTYTSCSTSPFPAGPSDGVCTPPKPAGSGWKASGSAYVSGYKSWSRKWKRTVNYSAVNDDMFFSNKTTLPSLDVVQNGVNIVRIKINCANIIGEQNPPTINTSTWDYTVSTSINKTTASPGDTITVTNTTSNLQSSTGETFTRRIDTVPKNSSKVTRVTSWGADNGKLTREYNVAGIAGKGSVSRTSNYTINAGASGQVCFQASIGTVRDGNEYGNTLCVTISQTVGCEGVTVTFDGAGQCNASISWPVAADTNGTDPFSFIRVSVPNNTSGAGSFDYPSTAGGTQNFTYDGSGAKARVRAYYKDSSGGYSIIELTGLVEYGPCVWSISESTSTTSPKPTDSTFPKPGETINLNVGAKNTGLLGSPSVLICTSVTAGKKYLTDASSKSKKEKISAGSTLQLNTNWTLKSETSTMDNDAKICIKVVITPLEGNKDIYTNEGPLENEYCYFIYNERFAFNNPRVSYQAANFPGASVTVTAKLDNSDLAYINAKYRGAVHSLTLQNTVTAKITGITGNASISDGTSINQSIINPSITFSTGSNGGDGLSVTVNKDAKVGDEICMTISWAPIRGYSDKTATSGQLTTGECFVVSDGPYVQIENGDIWAGANFDTSTSITPPTTCGATANSNSEIKSLRSNNGISNNSLWRGSFVEYAAFALGDISQFGSGVLVNDVTNLAENGFNDPKLPKLLTFANDTLVPGKYDNQPRCIPNYFSLLKGYSGNVNLSSSSVDVNALTDDTQYSTNASDLELTGTSLEGKQITLVVDGNVSISGDISYNQNKYGTADNLDIPLLIIVAKNDIFIDQNVEQVDALLISHGTIWTCADRFSAKTSVSTKVCDKQLVVNGAVIANKVNFMRTNGTKGGVRDVNSSPSERFNFSPEFLLSKPVLLSNVADTNALRVILSKDLPPIY